MKTFHIPYIWHIYIGIYLVDWWNISCILLIYTCILLTGLSGNYSTISRIQWQAWVWFWLWHHFFHIWPKPLGDNTSAALFKCCLHLLNSRSGPYNRYTDDIPLDLVFFSAYDALPLRWTGTMELGRGMSPLMSLLCTLPGSRNCGRPQPQGPKQGRAGDPLKHPAPF